MSSPCQDVAIIIDMGARFDSLHVPNGIVLLFIVDLLLISLKFEMGNINPILEATISENSIIIGEEHPNHFIIINLLPGLHNGCLLLAIFLLVIF